VWSGRGRLLAVRLFGDQLGLDFVVRFRGIVFISEAAVARRILDCLGLDSTPPPLARAQAPPEELEPPPADEGVDQVFPE
jgi:hypothetical protein